MNLRDLATDSLVSAVRILLGILQGILVIPLITKLLGTGEYGIWATILAIIGLAETAGGLHLHGAVNRYIRRDGPGTALGTVAVLSLGAALVTSTLFFVGTLLAEEHIDGLQSYPSLVLAGAGAIIITAKIGSHPLLNIIRAQLRVKQYEIALIARRGLVLVGAISAIYVFRNIVAGLVAMAVIQGVVFVILVIWFFYQYDMKFDLQAAKRYLEYGIPWVPKELAGSLTRNADRILILIFMGPVAAGVYAVAYGVTGILNQSTTIVNSTLYPRLSADWEGGKLNEVKIFYSIFSDWYITLVIPAAIGIVMLARPILRLLATTTTAERGVVVIPILVLGFAFRGLEDVFVIGVSASERTREIGSVTLAGAILNVALNLVLIPIIGLVGAAIATAIVQFLKTSVMYRLLTHEINLAIPYRQVLKAGIASAIMAGGLHFLDWLSWMQQLFVFPTVGALIYFTVLAGIGGLPGSIENALRKQINSMEILS